MQHIPFSFCESLGDAAGASEAPYTVNRRRPRAVRPRATRRPRAGRINFWHCVGPCVFFSCRQQKRCFETASRILNRAAARTGGIRVAGDSDCGNPRLLTSITNRNSVDPTPQQGPHNQCEGKLLLLVEMLFAYRTAKTAV